jgi:hypothetical protein
MSYTGTTLTLDFTISSSPAATWRVVLGGAGTGLQLWSIQIPAVTALSSATVRIPGVPNRIGPVFGMSSLSTRTAGVICADIASVNTGTP